MQAVMHMCRRAHQVLITHTPTYNHTHAYNQPTVCRQMHTEAVRDILILTYTHIYKATIRQSGWLDDWRIHT